MVILMTIKIITLATTVTMGKKKEQWLQQEKQQLSVDVNHLLYGLCLFGAVYRKYEVAWETRVVRSWAL